LVVCLLPDIFALAIQPRLLMRDIGSSSTDPSSAAVDAVIVTPFTRTRIWRGVQTSFGMAVILLVPLCLLAAALVLSTTHCDETQGEWLFILLALPLAAAIGLALRCNFGFRATDGGLGRAAQGYIALACAMPLFASWRAVAASGESTLLRLSRRWTRVHALLLVVVVIGSVTSGLIAWVQRLTSERISRRQQANKDD
jgi:hypothetical protein